METRLYYHCPLEAMYMAKNFGVKYTNEHDNIYIHPDSLPIFEPKEGDLLTRNGNKAMVYMASAPEYLKAIAKDFPTIIVRNNKPFITPKREGI